MTDKPPPTDYNALAKRYLDLWQDQVAKLARDPGQLGEAATAWTKMASAMMPNAQPQPAPAHDAKPTPATPPGAAPSAAAHGRGGVDLADILGRLSAVEQRLAVLEAKSAGPAGGKPARKSARRPPRADGGSGGTEPGGP